MNELQFANKVRQVLNLGARLDAPTRERLRAARERALERRRTASAAALVYADNVEGRFGPPARFTLNVVLSLALLAFGLISLYSAQNQQQAAEIIDTDSQLLAGELPIDAYLDKGFEAWLEKQQRRS